MGKMIPRVALQRVVYKSGNVVIQWLQCKCMTLDPVSISVTCTRVYALRIDW